MLKNDYVRPFVVSMAVSLFLVSATSAVPTNGTFNPEDGLSGWTVVPSEVEGTSITNNGGYALFQEDFDYSPISLEQVFTLPASALELSFDRIMESIGVGSPTTDSFTVSLLDESYNPLISYDPGVTWFYSIDTSVGELMAPGVSVFGNTVTLGVSSYANMNVLLAFDFFSEVDPAYNEEGELIPGLDGVITTVALDNVDVSVIPAPGALMLGLIGTATVGLIRKLKKISRT